MNDDIFLAKAHQQGRLIILVYEALILRKDNRPNYILE